MLQPGRRRVSPVRCWVVWPPRTRAQLGNLPCKSIDERSSLPYDWYSAQPGGLFFLPPLAGAVWAITTIPYEQLLDHGSYDRIDYDIEQPGKGWGTEADGADAQAMTPWTTQGSTAPGQNLCLMTERQPGPHTKSCRAPDAARSNLWEKWAGRAMDCGPSRKRTPRACVYLPSIALHQSFLVPSFYPTPLWLV